MAGLYSYLQHDGVDGSLDLDGEGVPGLVLVQGELVVDGEQRESGDGLAVRGRPDGFLVALSRLQDPRLQPLHLLPERREGVHVRYNMRGKQFCKKAL